MRPREAEAFILVRLARLTVVNDTPRADRTDAPERIDVERLADRIDAIIEARIDSQTRTLAGLLFAQALIVGGLAFAAARLA